MTLQAAELDAPFARAASVDDATATMSEENTLAFLLADTPTSVTEVIARERDERTVARAFTILGCDAAPASADANRLVRYAVFATVT